MCIRDRFNVLDAMTNAANRWGYMTQFSVLSGAIVYCLRSRGVWNKILVVGVYGYWMNHFHQLGSYFGVYKNMPWAYNQLANLDPKLRTTKILYNFSEKVRQRDAEREKGLSVLNDDDFFQEFYIDLIGPEAKKIFQRSYVENDYFEKNYQVPRMTEDTKKVPYLPDALDCFLARYCYHNFVRWNRRFGAFLGIRDTAE
eukprot:TRINITY_DN7022_c0_g1_i1.p1 TRINITY_DN7022_c0_g1~~TRINITY_DN7022_c0_g1_i1.p1  ORF type:complete len:199 (-),score=42.25 TRINITY_DN7022_c0_g1_i1:86-682(-)